MHQDPNINMITVFQELCCNQMNKPPTHEFSPKKQKGDIFNNTESHWYELNFHSLWITATGKTCINITQMYRMVFHSQIIIHLNGNILQHKNIQIKKFNTQIIVKACTVSNQVWLNSLDQQSGTVSEIYAYTMTWLNGQKMRIYVQFIF